MRAHTHRPAAAATSSRAQRSAQLDELFEAAIRDGRHAETSVTVCGRCGNWTPKTFHLTTDRKRLCAACSWAIGELSARGALAESVITWAEFQAINTNQLSKEAWQ